MMTVFEIILAILGSAGVVGAVGWVLSLGTRITVVETDQGHVKDHMKEQLENLCKLVEVRLDSIDYRLDRIERSMNGHLHKS